MKKEDLIDAVNEVDDNMLKDAENARISYMKNRGRKAVIRRTVLLLGAAACTAGIVFWQNRQKPEEIIENTPVSETAEPAPELEMITIQHELPVSGGMSAVMYYDLKNEKDYNPWSEDMEFEALPVYRRDAHPAGEAYGLSEEEMRKHVDDVLEQMQMTALSYSVEKAGDTLKGDNVRNPYLDPETVLAVRAETEKGTVLCDGYGSVHVWLNHDSYIDLPQEYTFTYSTDEEEAARIISYLHEQYPLMKEEKWGYDLTGDYTFQGEKHVQYQAYAVSDKSIETLLNYTYRKVSYGSDDNGHLTGFHIADGLASAEKIADYPVISLEEAYEQLYLGNCRYNTGIDPDKNHEIADVQLTYLNDQLSQYQIPYYQFMMDITDDLNHETAEGLRTYGIYLVPAVRPEYITISD